MFNIKNSSFHTPFCPDVVLSPPGQTAGREWNKWRTTESHALGPLAWEIPPWPTGDGAPTISRLSTHIGLLTHRRAGVNSCGRATSAPCILRTNGMGELYVFSSYRSPFKYPRFRPGIFLFGASLRWDAGFALMPPVKHFWAVCLMVACFSGNGIPLP